MTPEDKILRDIAAIDAALDAASTERAQTCGHCQAGTPFEHAEEIDDDTQRILDSFLPVFVHGYCVAMLWANTRAADGSDTDIDPAWWQDSSRSLWGIEAFAPEDRDDIRAVCERFVHATYGWLTDPRVVERGWEAAGHDFALTRNGHGAGFWDRGYGDVGTSLSEAARTFGESTAYVDTDDDTTDHLAHLDSHDGE